MHKAPAVLYPLGPSRFLACLLAILWLGGTLVFLLGFASQREQWGLPRQLGWVFVPLSAALLWHWWHHQRVGELHWDAQQWLLGDGTAAQPGTLRVHVDLQNYLWIEWRTLGTGRVEWIWLERQRAPMLWPELRRAVFA